MIFMDMAARRSTLSTRNMPLYSLSLLSRLTGAVLDDFQNHWWNEAIVKLSQFYLAVIIPLKQCIDLISPMAVFGRCCF